MTDIEYLKKYLSEDKLDEGLKQLKQGLPVQYIIGNVNFCGYEIIVNHNVLIPRFETEELVNYVVEYASKYFEKKLEIADLGTGSGCIAVALSKKLDVHVDAVDISRKALVVAKKNIIKNNSNVTIHYGNMLNPLSKKYDIIISNPPYISKDEEIMDVVKQNEPHKALYADNNGLYFYEQIIKDANDYLKEKNMIAFEIGSNQASEIIKFAKRYFPKSVVVLKQDLQKRDRFIFVFNNIIPS